MKIPLARLGASFTAALAVVATLAGCAASDESSASGQTHVTFAGDGYTLAGEAYVAQAKGYFADEGLSSTVRTFATGIDGIKAMIAHQVDFAFGLDFAAVSTATPNVVILGSVGTPGGGYNQMYFGKGIKTPEDLSGKKLGVLAGTAQEYLTHKWVEKNGLEGRVETVQLPGIFEIVSALKTGQIGGAFVFGDGAKAASQDTHLTKFGDDNGLLATQGIYLLTLRKTLEERPELVEKVLRALRKSTELMKEDPDGTGAIIAKAENGDAKSVSSQIVLDNPALDMSDAQVSGLKDIEDFLTGNGTIDPTVNLDDSIQLDPMKKVLAEDTQ